MSRRRRPHREIPFSFDSFLDVVANVVGIIIRLILVAWVGARSYKAIMPPPPAPPAALVEPATLPDPTDPRPDQIARHRLDLHQQRDQALRSYHEQEQSLRDDLARLQLQLAGVAEQRLQRQQEQARWQAQATKGNSAAQGVLLSVAELQKRSSRLLAELEKLKKSPRQVKQLRYHTPVSAAVQTEEVMFECKESRVTLLDTAALLEEVRRVGRAKGDQLRERWEVSDVTAPVGAFRLHYTIERQRTALDGPGSGAPAGGVYRFGLSGWEAEPVLAVRGETADKALSSDSAFRKVVDALDPQQTVVTLWVYPDSFPLYRALRDYLHGKEIVVAGRPLPEGHAIASSRQGTVSRGQ
jgi:hypothetical protein